MLKNVKLYHIFRKNCFSLAQIRVRLKRIKLYDKIVMIDSFSPKIITKVKLKTSVCAMWPFSSCGAKDEV